MNYLQRKRLALMRNRTFRGYLRAAAGYPVTLYATLADKPKSLTIYGNDGGVGDRTGNLFDDKKWVINAIVNDANGAIVNNQGNIWETAGTGTSYLSIANYYFAIPAGTTKLCISQDLKIWYGYRIGFYDANKSFLSCVSHLVMSSGENNVTVPDGAAYFAISRRRDHGTAAYVMINVGSTALPYEPYGYKIPILAQGRNLFDKDYWSVLSASEIESMRSLINRDGSDNSTVTVIPLGIGAGEYTFSVQSGGIQNGYYYGLYDIADGEVVSRVRIYNSSQWISPVTITVTGELYIGSWFNSPSLSGQPVAAIRNMLLENADTQIQLGNIATPYEPYINKTINLYAPQQLEARESVNLFSGWNTRTTINTSTGSISKSSSTVIGNLLSDAIEVDPDTIYTFGMADSNGGSSSSALCAWDINGDYCGYTSAAGNLISGSLSSQRAVFQPSQAITSTTGQPIKTIRIFRYYNESRGGLQRSLDEAEIATYLVEGNYASVDVMPKEPYGATIADTLTIADSTATLSPKATGGDDTDVTTLQDWTQDMTLPEAEQLTVSAGTAVEPSGIEVEYWSKNPS